MGFGKGVTIVTVTFWNDGKVAVCTIFPGRCYSDIFDNGLNFLSKNILHGVLSRLCRFACSLSSSFCCCSCWFMIFLQLARRSEISSFVLSFSVRFGVVRKCS